MRFLVIGPLMAAPPAPRQLGAAFLAPAAKTWCHPVSGLDLRFGASTLERWYYRVRATLNKSLAARSALLWAVCGVANPRHSWAMPVVCALQPIPNQGAHTRGDLFSAALAFHEPHLLGGP